MSSEAGGRTPYEIVEQEKEAYLEELPEEDSDWPADVLLFYREIHNHLFEDILVKQLRQKCGLANHNISSHFKEYVGRTPKQYILHHRIELAKRLLRHEEISVTQVAFAVGHRTPNAFSMAFKRRVGCSPVQYNGRER